MRYLIIAVLLFQVGFYLNAQNTDSVYFTTGFKIGEVTNSSAIILTRLCGTPEPVKVWHERKESVFRNPINFNNVMPVQKMEGPVQGSTGQVKITLNTKDTLISADWKYVSSYKDFTLKKKFEGLIANTSYSITIKGRKNPKSPITEIKGQFSTPALDDQIAPVFFTSSTCQCYWSFDDTQRGFKIYDSMLKPNSLFHCQTGDYVYYDKPGPMAYNVELARHKWHTMNSWPSVLDFYRNTPLFIQKDDHDLLRDDAGSNSLPLGELTYEDGLYIWQEQVPIINTPYRIFRWGKDLQNMVGRRQRI